MYLFRDEYQLPLKSAYIFWLISDTGHKFSYLSWFSLFITVQLLINL